MRSVARGGDKDGKQHARQVLGVVLATATGERRAHVSLVRGSASKRNRNEHFHLAGKVDGLPGFGGLRWWSRLGRRKKVGWAERERRGVGPGRERGNWATARFCYLPEKNREKEKKREEAWKNKRGEVLQLFFRNFI